MAAYRRKLRKATFCILLALLTVFFFCYHSQRHVYTSESERDAIPKQIFQTAPTQETHSLRQRLGESVQSWAMNNPDFTYKLFSDEGVIEFVMQEYAAESYIWSTFMDICIPVLRADLFRYMLLERKGGYYGDVDTTLYKPIKHWVPTEYRGRVKFIVGIEYDQLENPEPSHEFTEHISFAQWTFGASKDHPILKKVIGKAMDALHYLAKETEATIATLEFADHLVGRLTGPQIFTSAVFEGMSEAMGKSITWEDVTGITKPRLYGDILLMPVDAFGTGQPHSGASPDITETTCVRHQWKMSWRQLNRDGSMKLQARL